MGKFHQILTKLSARDTPRFLFLDNNFSKCQGILIKLGTCIDMKEVWFGIAKGKICQFLTVICLWQGIIVLRVFLFLISLGKHMLGTN